MATEPLNLLSLRKQQRRVAALMNRERTGLPHHSIKRQDIPVAASFPLGHWCSRLDTAGTHQNPALTFMREGLRYAKKKGDDLLLDFGEVQYRKRRRARRTMEYNSQPNALSTDNVDNGYDSEISSFHNESNTGMLPAVAMSNSSGRGQSIASDCSGTVREKTNASEANDLIKFPLKFPSLAKSKVTEATSPSITPRLPTIVTTSRQNSNTIRVPTISTSHGDISLPPSPSKLKVRTRTFYSSIPDISENPERIDYDNYRANLEYQHGVPPLPDDKIRSLLDSRQDTSRRTSGAASNLPILVDRLDTRDSARWCTCGYKPPKLPPANQCSECKHELFHETTCSKYSKDKIPLCPKCRKPLRLHSNTESAINSVMNRTLERLTKTNSVTFDNSEKQTALNNMLKKNFNLRNRGKTSKASANELSVDCSDHGESDRLVNIDGRLQTPDSYLMSVETKISSGKFDYDVDLNVEDVGKSPRPGEEIHSDEDDDINHEAGDGMGELEDGIDWSSDIYRTAYIRALADARAKNLPQFPEYLDMRTSRAFVFSYFEHVPNDCKCPKCLQPSLQEQTKNKKSEMKMIFGDINPDDYLPGGPKGPRVKRKRQKTKSLELELPKVEKPENSVKAKLKMTKH